MPHSVELDMAFLHNELMHSLSFFFSWANYIFLDKVLNLSNLEVLLFLSACLLFYIKQGSLCQWGDIIIDMILIP